MKRLYRNTDDQMIAGVCSGIAEYVNVDPTAIRLAFLVLMLAGGSGFWIYIVMWIIMPIKPAVSKAVDVVEKAPAKPVSKSTPRPAAKTAGKKPASSADRKKTPAKKTTIPKKTDAG